MKSKISLRKRGQMQLLNLIIGIGLIIFVIGGLVIGLGAFRVSTLEDGGANNSNASLFLGSGLEMYSNFGGQLGTVGTLIGVGLLIAVIMGAFAIGNLRGDQGGGGF